MPDSATPATPQRASREHNSLQSTPFARGSGSNITSEINTNRERYRAFLREDLKSLQGFGIDEFLEHILGWKNTNANLGIVNKVLKDKKFKDLLENYEKVEGDEKKQYAPFVKLANHAVDEMRTKFKKAPKEEICFRLHANRVVSDSVAARKPDTVVVPKEDAGTEIEVARQSWYKLMGFVEHKIFVDSKPKAEPKSKSSASGTKVGSGSRGRGGKSSRGRSIRPSTQTSGDPVRSSTRIQELSQPAEVQELSESLQETLKVSDGLSSNTNESPAASNQVILEPGEKRPPTHEEELLQCANYGLEMLSNGGIRNHALGFLVSNTRFEALYFDRSTIISCEAFNLAQEPEKFLKFMMCLSLLSREDWGIPDWIKAPALLPVPPRKTGEVSGQRLTGHVIKLSNGDTLTIKETIYRQHGIIGRGTQVYRATWEKAKNVSKKSGKRDEARDVIVKIAWTPTSRTAETEFLEAARTRARNHGDEEAMLKHLPDILYSEAMPVSKVQHGLQAAFKDDESRYEPRVPQLTIHDELHPITELKTAEDLLKAMRDIFNCYRWLYEKVGILHRDISLNNLMYRKDNEGVIYGVLNDLDLAVFLHAHPGSSKQRTGTKPYLAIDLLADKPPKHLYRHDLESYFYVFLWITFHYHNGRPYNDNSPFKNWVYEDHTHLRAAKSDFMLNDSLSEPTANFVKLQVHLLDMRDAIRNGLFARTTHEGEVLRAKLTGSTPKIFDNETLNGRVSFHIFQEILDRDLPP